MGTTVGDDEMRRASELLIAAGRRVYGDPARGDAVTGWAKAGTLASWLAREWARARRSPVVDIGRPWAFMAHVSGVEWRVRLSPGEAWVRASGWPFVGTLIEMEWRRDGYPAG